MNDSHLFQYPIRSLMSSTVRREQLTQNLPMTGVAKGILIQGQGTVCVCELEGGVFERAFITGRVRKLRLRETRNLLKDIKTREVIHSRALGCS